MSEASDVLDFLCVRFTRLDERLDRIDRKLDEIVTRLGALERKLAGMRWTTPAFSNVSTMSIAG